MKKSSKIILSALASAGVLAAAATAWAYPAGGQPQAGYPCPAGGPMLGPGPVMPQGAQGKACKSSKDHSKPRNEADTSLKSPVNRGFFLATQWVYMI